MIQKGSKVKWEWGNGTATGKVTETYTKEVTKTIDGRNGRLFKYIYFFRRLFQLEWMCPIST